MPHAEPADDPLSDLRARIAETRRAAERIAGEVPPNGWATPRAAREAQDELAALAGLLQALRDLVPPELEAQLNDVLRSVLLLLRAIVDWLVERLDAPPPAAAQPAAPRVQDIPLE
jgi:peptidoglycan/xylan/chitin deacetylase (PgdA/CDA1 family)